MGKEYLPETKEHDSQASFEAQWLRKLFFQLRHGVEHEGKTYVIDAPYCIKVEFHECGWVHYQLESKPPNQSPEPTARSLAKLFK